MAEVAGVVLGAVGVAGLFSACVDVFELVKICHTREHSLEILTTKLGNQKARFVIWGRTMGLDKAQEGGGHDARLDEPVRRDSVMRTMKLIIKLFDESDVLTERYGLRKWEDVLGFGSALDYRPENAVWRDMFRRAQRKLGRLKRKNDAMPAKVPATLRWAIVDQDRFLKLVNDLRDLVDDLESMTRFPDIAERRRRIVAYEVESISDVASLEAVMEAGETDPTELSDSASLLVESMSVNSQGLGSRSTPGRSLSSEAGTFCSARSYLSPLRSIEKEPHLSAKEPSRLASHRSEEEPFNRVQHRIEKKLPTLASSELTPKGLWALGKLTRMRKEEVPYRLHPVLPDADPVFKAWVNASRAAFQRILEDNRAFVRLLPDLPQPKASPHTNNQAKQAHEHIIWELKKQMGSFVNERFTFCPIEVSNFHHLFGLVLGASGTPYAGGLFFLDITYPTEYPFKPNRVHHPRISDRGNILDLPRWNGEGEGPVDVFGKVIPPMKDKRNLRFDVPELLFTIQSETLGPLPEMNLCLFTQSNRDSRILDLSLIESYEIFSATTQFRTLQFADHRLPYNIKRFNLQRIDEALKTGTCKDVHDRADAAQPAAHRHQGVRAPDAVPGRHQGRHPDRHRPLRQQVLREPGRGAAPAHALGRLQGQGVQPGPDRARLARLDVVHDRQAAARRPHPADGPPRLGADRAPAQRHHEPRRVPAVLDGQAEDERVDTGGEAAVGMEHVMDGTWMVDRGPVSKLRARLAHGEAFEPAFTM